MEKSIIYRCTDSILLQFSEQETQFHCQMPTLSCNEAHFNNAEQKTYPTHHLKWHLNRVSRILQNTHLLPTNRPTVRLTDRTNMELDLYQELLH